MRALAVVQAGAVLRTWGSRRGQEKYSQLSLYMWDVGSGAMRPSEAGDSARGLLAAG